MFVVPHSSKAPQEGLGTWYIEGTWIETFPSILALNATSLVNIVTVSHADYSLAINNIIVIVCYVNNEHTHTHTHTQTHVFIVFILLLLLILLRPHKIDRE